MKHSDEWDKDDQGRPIMSTLLDAAIIPVSSGNFVFRVEFANGAPHHFAINSGQAEPSHLQLGLTPEQAERLGEYLIESAKTLRRQSTPPSNAKN